MGLDMYLYYRANVRLEESDYAYEFANSLFPSTERAPFSLNLAYWRKANAIHRWFVDNVQDGNDDREEYEVTIKQLAQLKSVCQSILDYAEAHGITEAEWNQEHVEIPDNVRQFCHSVLPTQSGFFFGSTEYDKWYLLDVVCTVKSIEAICSILQRNYQLDFKTQEPIGKLYYRASW